MTTKSLPVPCTHPPHSPSRNQTSQKLCGLLYFCDSLLAVPVLISFVYCLVSFVLLHSLLPQEDPEFLSFFITFLIKCLLLIGQSVFLVQNPEGMDLSSSSFSATQQSHQFVLILAAILMFLPHMYNCGTFHIHNSLPTFSPLQGCKLLDSNRCVVLTLAPSNLGIQGDTSL